jgi:hypothetical protein
VAEGRLTFAPRRLTAAHNGWQFPAWCGANAHALFAGLACFVAVIGASITPSLGTGQWVTHDREA